MPDPVLPDRVLKSAGDRLLPYQVREGLGAVAERQHLVVVGARRGRRLRGRRRIVGDGRRSLRVGGRRIGCGSRFGGDLLLGLARDLGFWHRRFHVVRGRLRIRAGRTAEQTSGRTHQAERLTPAKSGGSFKREAPPARFCRRADQRSRVRLSRGKSPVTTLIGLCEIPVARTAAFVSTRAVAG